MELHPARVEVGDDAVQVDTESHPITLRSSAAAADPRTIDRPHRLAALLLALTAAASSCGGEAEPEVARSYVLDLRVDDSEDRYRYVADGPVDIRVGDEVTFELRNTGTLIHDLQVVDPSGSAIATAPPTAPGADVSLTVHFEEAGFHRLNCLVDDHLTAHRMQSVIEVTDSSG